MMVMPQGDILKVYLYTTLPLSFLSTIYFLFFAQLLHIKIKNEY